MRPLALTLVALLAAGCTSLGFGGDDGLRVLDDLAPYEVRVSLENTADAPVRVGPEGFRIEGSDGHVFPGWPSAREPPIGNVTLAPGGRVEGWVAFDVQARALAPATLVFESDGLRLEKRLESVS